MTDLFAIDFYCGLPYFLWFRNNLVLELDNMTRLAEKCNIQVPMEVLK